MPLLHAIHVPDPAVYIQGQPETFVPLWQGTEPEPPEGADVTDLDLDGLPAWYELWLGTQPGDPDTDDDGATDLEEIQDMGTDPRMWDSSGNDVGDREEWLLRHADTDSDSLSDWDETHVHGTDPVVFDTDMDGLGDSYEVATSRDSPSESKAASNPLAENTDGDAFPDAVDAECYFPSDWQPTLAIQPLPAGGLPVGEFLQPYSHTFTLQHRTAAAAWGPYVWDGIMPSGLALVPAENGLSCQLTGTVQVDYNGSYRVRVTDAYGNTDQVHFDFHVDHVDDSGPTPLQPEIIANTSPLPPVSAGEFFSVHFSTTPHSPMDWWLSGTAPPGLALDPMGHLSGTVEPGAAPGWYSFTIHAAVEGVPVSAEHSILVQQVENTHLTIVAPEQPLLPAMLDSPYQAQFATNRPGQQVQWSVSGEVPAGLWIDGTGLLSGAVSSLPSGGMAQFTVHAWTQAESTEQTVWLHVQEPSAPTLSIHTDALPLPDASPGSAYQVAFSTSPYIATGWEVSGSLPPGLSFSNGLLSGTVDAAAAPGWYAFTLTASCPWMDGCSLSLEIQVPSQDFDTTDSGADQDGDGLSAGLEQELSQESGLSLTDTNPASLGYHDWLVYYFVRVSPNDTDRDGDGLGDQLEQQFFQTNPDATITGPGHTPDTIRFWLAYFQFFSWYTATDTDSDGLPDSLEELLGINLSAVDTDGDGSSDADEVHLGGWFIFGSDPAVADSDLDGLSDGYEASVGTDPRRVDSDGDHLTDAEETQSIFGTFNPLLYDSDADGSPDFAEADLTDSDGGGIPDRLEQFWNMNLQDARDEAYDVDSNGVSNRDSYLNGWDIYAQWTPQFDDDNDGMTNVYEIARGLNPNDPTDGADDPDGDYLTQAEEARAHTSTSLAMTPGFEDNTISILDAQGSSTGTRLAQSDYEAATGHSLRPPLPGRPDLTRDNGPDVTRQYDDDWDGDGISNRDELYPATGEPTDPRVFDAEDIAFGISLSSGSTQVVQGSEVNLTFVAQGGTAPYHNWGLNWLGSLPEGLTWDSATSTLQGTAQALPGSYAFEIYVSDALGTAASLPMTLNVMSPPLPEELQITTSHLPAAVQGQSYAASLRVSHAQNGIVGWSLTSGDLPAGIMLSEWGSLTGLAETEPGAYSFTVQVTDGAGRIATASFSITVTELHEPPPPPPSPLTIQTRELPVLQTGSAYAFTPIVTGGSNPYTWQVASGALPQGLVLSPQTGTLSGIIAPSHALRNESIYLDLRVIDSSGAMAQQTLTLPLQHQPPMVTSPVQLYWVDDRVIAFEGTGGFAPYTWVLESGTLPPAVSLLPNGSLMGPRPTTGTWSFSVTLTDRYGQQATSPQLHRLVVDVDGPPTNPDEPDIPDDSTNNDGNDPAPEVLRITTTQLPQIKVGESIDTRITASGGKGPYQFSGYGNGFTGLSVASNGQINYTATRPGQLSITVSVIDNNRSGASQVLSFTVEEEEEEEPPPTPGTGVSGPNNGSPNNGDDTCTPGEPPDEDTEEPEAPKNEKRDVSVSIQEEVSGKTNLIYTQQGASGEWKATLDLKGEIQVQGTDEPAEPPAPYSFWVEEVIPGTAISWTTPNNAPLRQENTLRVKLVLTGKPTNPEDYGEKTIRVRGPGGEASMKFRLLPMELKQDNMPNFGVAENTTDMASPYSTATIRGGGVAYITGQPAMPQLKASFPGLAANINVEWKLEIKTERTERGTKDDKNYPASGYKTLPGNQAWDIGAEFGTDFVGGKCKLFYKVGGGAEQTLEFFIRGKNPLDADSRNYARNHAGAANHRAAWAICQHESRQGSRVHNQFNASGSTKELPNFSGNYPTEDGWGIAQLDRPMGVSATRDDVYSWKSNIDKLFQELDSKKADAERFIRWIRNKWGNDARWEEPPASWTVSSSSFTPLALASMVLYNGASGVPWSSGVNDNGANASFRSPWSFDPSRPAGSRWQFHDNLNPVSNHPYATTVIVDEWEHGLQTAE